MIDAGIYHTLRVNRISDFGLYLSDAEGDEVLLPNRYTSLSNKVGDEIRVFVYHDSEDRLVASTETPYATVGEIAFLRVVDKRSTEPSSIGVWRPRTCSCPTEICWDMSNPNASISSISIATTSQDVPLQPWR